MFLFILIVIETLAVAVGRLHAKVGMAGIVSGGSTSMY